MGEYTFDLGAVDPKLFSGEDNKHISLLKEKFPKLKVIARGNIIKVRGTDDDIENFGRTMKKLLGVYEKRSRVSTHIFEEVLGGGYESIYQNKDSGIVTYGVSGNPIRARTANQKVLVDLVRSHDMVFAVGPAGTGKTYTGVALAVEALKNKEVKRIILTRPAVEAGEDLGFLPGDLKEKMDPYMRPLYDALHDMIPPERLREYLETGIIEIAPLAFMRGRTLDRAFVILDEAQNTTSSQMKMFLTRMGMAAKFVITGDLGQIDLPTKIPSGLKNVLCITEGISGIGAVYLKETDVVRHPLVKSILSAYENSKNTDYKLS